MSQAGPLSSGGGPPPPPGTDITFGLDVGTTTSVLSVMIVTGVDSIANNANGIFTNANPNLSNVTEIVLSNRITGTATVVGAVTGDIVTFSLGGSAAVYRFQFDVVGRDTGTGDGVGYSVFATFRTNGAAATLIDTPGPFVDHDEDASLLLASMTMIASGNNAILRATGVAGQTINYNAVGTYVVV